MPYDDRMKKKHINNIMSLKKKKTIWQLYQEQ